MKRFIIIPKKSGGRITTFCDNPNLNTNTFLQIAKKVWQITRMRTRTI